MWRFGLGGQYAWSKALTVNCAYELSWFGICRWMSSAAAGRARGRGIRKHGDP